MQQSQRIAQNKSETYNAAMMSETPAAPSLLAPVTTAPALAAPRSLLPVVALIAILSLVGNFLLWNKLARIQNNLASASAQAQILAQEAKLLATSSAERSDSAQAKLALIDAKLDAFNAQNTQVEALLQNAARTQSDYLLSDIDSSLRLAQQQAQFTGNAQTLIDALQQAQQRLGQSGQGGIFLQPVLAAISRDLERLKTSAYSDIPSAVDKLDQLASRIDQLPMLAQQPSKLSDASLDLTTPRAAPQAKWQQWLMPAWLQVRSLLQISRVDMADAALISPEELYFVRENIKLQLLSARTALLSRRLLAAQSAMTQVQKQLKTYSDSNTPAYKKAQELLTQAQNLSGNSQDSVPTANDSARAIAAAYARYQASQTVTPANAPKTQGARKP